MVREISKEKLEHLKKLSTDNNVISALAIDQRGSLRKMIQQTVAEEDIQAAVEQFKVLISEELTPYASSILLDPEYGLKAADQRADEAGLLLAYEETGYDATQPGRMPDLLPIWSAFRIKNRGANGVKFLLYYDADEGDEINEAKHAFVERIGSECEAEDIPFFLEILSYDANIQDAKGVEYARLKPAKVKRAMEEFSKEKYQVDVLKVEVPVNMAFVEGYAEAEVVYSREEALQYFREQDESTQLPYIYLSAGVSAELFNETLKFANEAGCQFNGVLCGRATWKDSVDIFAEQGDEAARQWLQTQGRENIQNLNEAIESYSTPWTDKIKIKEK